MSRRAVFLDRDGTLIHDRHFLSHPENLRLFDGVVDALGLLRDRNLALVVLSNQSGVARGILGLEAVEAVNAELRRQLSAGGIELDGIYVCPHHPEGSVPEFRRVCECRKPAPGLALRAAEELGLILDGSWIVGDKIDDVNMALQLPLRPVLVRTGYGRESEKTLDDPARIPVADDLTEAVKLILEWEGRS